MFWIQHRPAVAICLLRAVRVLSTRVRRRSPRVLAFHRRDKLSSGRATRDRMGRPRIQRSGQPLRTDPSSWVTPALLAWRAPRFEQLLTSIVREVDRCAQRVREVEHRRRRTAADVRCRDESDPRPLAGDGRSQTARSSVPRTHQRREDAQVRLLSQVVCEPDGRAARHSATRRLRPADELRQRDLGHRAAARASSVLRRARTWRHLAAPRHWQRSRRQTRRAQCFPTLSRANHQTTDSTSLPLARDNQYAVARNRVVRMEHTYDKSRNSDSTAGADTSRCEIVVPPIGVVGFSWRLPRSGLRRNPADQTYMFSKDFSVSFLPAWRRVTRTGLPPRSCGQPISLKATRCRQRRIRDPPAGTVWRSRSGHPARWALAVLDVWSLGGLVVR